MSADDSARGGFLRSARVISSFTLVSRLLGLVRDAAMAHVLGAGAVHDALTFAWTVPNAFRRLFGEGALSTAFVPVFSRVLEAEGRAAAARLARELVCVLGLALMALAGVLALGAGLLPDAWLSGLFGAEHMQKARLTVAYVQLLLPYLAVICVIAQLMAVLNALDEFAVPALAPVLLNLVWLGGVGVAAVMGSDEPSGFDLRARQGFVIIGAILVAAGLQFLWHLPRMAQLGVPFRLVRPRVSPELRQVMTSMGPMVLGMGAAQLNLVADRSIALMALPDGGATHLYYGLRVQQFPMGLVTVALATAAYPAMTRLMAREDRMGAAHTASLALRTNLLVGLPATVGLVVLAEPIVTLLFQSGGFDAEDSRLTASALRGYGWGIPFAGTAMLLQRACYASGDLRLPLVTGLAMVVVNVGLDLALVGPFGEEGLALATSLSAVVSAAWLLLGVRRRLVPGPGQRLLSGLLPAVLVSAIMAAAVSGLDLLLAQALEPGRLTAGLRVGAGSLAGLVVFALAGPRLCPHEWQALSSVWRRGTEDQPSE
jgi:putative peptidoglycan lipid II flippase